MVAGLGWQLLNTTLHSLCFYWPFFCTSLPSQRWMVYLKYVPYIYSTLVPFYNNNKLNNGFYIALLSPVDVLLSWLQFALIKTSLISPSQQRICLTRITTPPNGYLISRSHCVLLYVVAFYPRDQHQQHSKAFQLLWWRQLLHTLYFC